VIRLEHRDGVAIVSLDRPERANALAPELLAALGEQLALVRQQ
jgi:enoyl-CoA hydratase/carnithine racemase